MTCFPHLGDGLLARLREDVVLLVGGDPGGQETLLDLCVGIARSGGDGRALVRALAAHATAVGADMPPCVALAAVDSGMVAFVHGDAELEAGNRLHLKGSDSIAWIDRVIPWPMPDLTAMIGGPRRVPTGPFNLRDGVVAAAGFSLVPARPDGSSAMPDVSASSERADAQPEAAASGSRDFQVSLPPEVDRPVAEEEPPAFESVAVDLHSEHDEDDGPRAPLPIAGTRPPREKPTDDNSVLGVFCKNNHFNDPRQLFCGVCGINMVQQTPILTNGARPPLGVLVLDDGAVFQVDADYVIGREPEHDPAVQSGERRGITLKDEFRTVSRAHARVELRGWDVLLHDNGSANGTYAAAERDPAWTQLVPDAPYPLQSGTRIAIGRRILIYNTHRAS